MRDKGVTTKKVHKKKLKIKNFLILLLIVGVIALCGYGYSQMSIKRIIIKGTSFLEDNYVIRLAKLEDYPKIINVSSSKVKKELLSEPLISKVKVSKNLLGYITLDIEEAEVLFFNKNQNKTVLSNGKTIDKDNFVSLPTLINYVPDEIYADLISGFKDIDKDIRALISEIEYSPSKDANGETLDDTRFILRMNDGNMVHMNTINIKKLNSYIKIFSTTDMPNKKGVLYLDSRTDNVVFKTYDAIAKEEQENTSEEEVETEN